MSISRLGEYPRFEHFTTPQPLDRVATRYDTAIARHHLPIHCTLRSPVAVTYEVVVNGAVAASISLLSDGESTTGSMCPMSPDGSLALMQFYKALREEAPTPHHLEKWADIPAFVASCEPSTPPAEVPGLIKGGRPRHPEDEWAREQIQNGTDRATVMASWVEKRTAVGRDPDLLADIENSFAKAIRGVKRKK